MFLHISVCLWSGLCKNTLLQFSLLPNIHMIPLDAGYEHGLLLIVIESMRYFFSEGHRLILHSTNRVMNPGASRSHSGEVRVNFKVYLAVKIKISSFLSYSSFAVNREQEGNDLTDRSCPMKKCSHISPHDRSIMKTLQAF